jgi:hypothetical protein
LRRPVKCSARHPAILSVRGDGPGIPVEDDVPRLRRVGEDRDDCTRHQCADRESRDHSAAVRTEWRLPGHGDLEVEIHERAVVDRHVRVAHADDAEDVRVRGVRPEPVRTTIPAEDVRQMPGAFGDPFRFVEALPGVTPIVYWQGPPPGHYQPGGFPSRNGRIDYNALPTPPDP